GSSVQFALYSAGNAMLEVVQAADGAPAFNFSHVALGVDDLDAALAAWRGRGVAFAGAGPTTNATRTMRMSDPATTGGVVYQLIQWYVPTIGAGGPSAQADDRGAGIGVVKVDHVAAVVADYGAAKRLLTDRLGLPVTLEDAVPDRRLRFAYFGLDN